MDQKKYLVQLSQIYQSKLFFKIYYLHGTKGTFILYLQLEYKNYINKCFKYVT